MHLRQYASPISVFCLAVIVALIVTEKRLATSVAQTTAPSRQLDRQTTVVKVWPSKNKRWALIIGVDQYRDAQINALRGSVNDAHALADALVSYAGFPPDQVIVLSTDQPEERQPTRINVLTYLSNLAALVPKDGLLLFSFAGHGIERGGQAFLIPSDARLSRDISLLEESAVSVTRMHDRIKAIGVGQVIVLLDACRNDPGGRSGVPNNMTAPYTKFNFDVRNREVQAFATLYATAIGRRAYEYTEKKQGYFTWAIVEALKGGAANEQGEVTLAALLKYVQESVAKRIAIDLGPSEEQKPFARIEGYRADELVIAVAPAKLPPLEGGLLDNKVVVKPVPDYPEAAKASGVGGDVVVRLTIDESGRVIEAIATDGPMVLRASAEKAARQALFSPTKLSGQPVRLWGYLVYHFEASLVDSFSTSQECLAAISAPFYRPSLARKQELGSDEVVRGHPTGGCFELALPDRVRGRGWVRIEAGRPFVYNRTTHVAVRLAASNNHKYDEVPFP